MKTLLAMSGLGISLLGIIGALGWILAILVAVLLPGGSLLMLAAHYFNRRRHQTEHPVAIRQHSSCAA